MDDAQTIELAQALVRIDSVNPSLVPGAAGEAELASHVLAFLQNAGIEAGLQEAVDGRPNVVGRIPGDGDGPSLLLCCHLDTVSVEGMSAPFSARVEDGRLYGRGAQDVKGGLAAMLAAARILAEGKRPKGDVILAAVADEEAYSKGTEALLDSGLRADGAIVFEPTELDVVVAHKGFAWLAVETAGVAAHGSKPELGVDAIANMGRVLTALSALDHELRSRPPHPLLQTGSVHASLIRGGRELSSYPDRCRLDLERRTVPGETEDRIVAEIESLARGLDATVSLDFFRPAFEIDARETLPQTLKTAVENVKGRCEFTGMTGWTDSALLAAADIPAVVFGPGGSGLHGLDEYGNTRQICQCRDILVEALTGKT